MTVSNARRAVSREPDGCLDIEPRLTERLFATRNFSTTLAAPLSAEDQVVQANDDASPTKWHLAHTTWFFETFLLKKHLPFYREFDPSFGYCFNSYYEAEGERHPRSTRGLLTRPSHDSVIAYRAHVDDGLAALCARKDNHPDVAALIETGINHEQQHQELLLTDILSLFAANPLRPAYLTKALEQIPASAPQRPLTWTTFPSGIHQIGAQGDSFSFDNEGPRHDALLQPFRIADRLVTNGEWIDFVNEGGYRDPTFWLADGWATVRREGWKAPLYWDERDGTWLQMSLSGQSEMDLQAPVRHVSYYEADAFARWAGKRLPTEFEWEIAARTSDPSALAIDLDVLRPRAARGAGLSQMFGDVWQWTQSAYLPYPGYRPPPGAIGEYNGKFMCGQHVLRGSSCVTPEGHTRDTYRNFFYPHQRWQFCGLRLADEA
jgi:ergothioneine biosynthesis protein EgtB